MKITKKSAKNGTMQRVIFNGAMALFAIGMLTMTGCSDSDSSDSSNTLTSTSAGTTSSTTTAAYKQSGGSESQSNQTYTASNTDESAVYVTNSGQFTLTNSTIITTGNTSSQDNSSFYGLNAAVLAESGSAITLSNSTISTTGTGANGAFATGSGSSVALSNVTITATGDGGHGVMATQGGSVTLTEVNIATTGASSAPIATDRGSGTITMTGGSMKASGQNSPCIYSTGVITVSNSACATDGSETAVIEGGNSISLTNTTLSSSKDGKWGVMIYQSMSGDAEGTQGTFEITGGSLAYTGSNGPLFYVTNSTGIITLNSVSVTAASGTLLNASAGNWGASGSNGGTAIFTANGQALSGNFVADNLSAMTISLKNGSSLTGAINADNAAKTASLTLDSSSTWNVTADSYLTCLNNSGSINSNGHTVLYNSSACSTLGGKTYALNGGGSLKPIN
ncbi:hypothetical protein U14_01154 [Candidatus Moduliflexus flocculans]|uniref:Uncharacterized protein n=1 Tax=Candidatus Moduliflexus flocculans TaxID=1499966 RepID=A0A0S6VRG9_9BACT|nr:hypothetical protein U14_01154 [Candidatus Moduliflexus flocculans]